eukprot:m.210282 g.210282  ORF g.210282 m.210282 type:complete len:199 (+) comp26122_c0_seq10:514-1110(+)
MTKICYPFQKTDPQVISLLKYAIQKNCSFFGIEYGNEDGYPVDLFVGLQPLLDDLYAAIPHLRPRIIGPDPMQSQDPGSHMGAFLNATYAGNVSMYAATYHYYLQVSSTSQPASVLDKLRDFSAPVQQQVLGSATPNVQLWMGEEGGHSGGGVDGATNTYASGQWYLDALGTLALLGHTVSILCISLFLPPPSGQAPF